MLLLSRPWFSEATTNETIATDCLLTSPINNPLASGNLPKPERPQRYWLELPKDNNCDSIEFKKLLLDEGFGKLVLPFTDATYDSVATFVETHLAPLPKQRLALALPLSEKDIDSLVSALPVLATAVSAFVFQTQWSANILSEAATVQVLKRVCDAVRSASNSCPALVIVLPSSLSDPTASQISNLSELGFDVVLQTMHIAKDEAETKTRLSLGSAIAACLVSDRPDGLFPTIVTDESNVALGLVYSSKDSLNASIQTGKGVYQSRQRGLWHKGATSGAIQILKRIDVDCDRDCLRFTVKQMGEGFCHLNTRSCFGLDTGLTALETTLLDRKSQAPEGSYTKRLFDDMGLLRSKVMEEAEELCDATTAEEIAFEAADLIYFALVRCVGAGVSVADVEHQLDMKSQKVSRRPGNAKSKWTELLNPVVTPTPATQKAEIRPSRPNETLLEPSLPIEMRTIEFSKISDVEKTALLQRPIQRSDDIMNLVRPIIDDVRNRGDQALIDLTAKFDKIQITAPVLRAPFATPDISPKVRAAIDLAFSNVHKFHAAQLQQMAPLHVETQPGVTCSRFSRPISRVGLYVPGGTAILPSTTLMLGVPAMVAGCKEIVIASPPRKDGTAVPEVVYVASKIGASAIVLAGGAQAVAAMAYGTQTVPKVDKIYGPGNQYVTAAKMVVQNDHSSLVSIDMPAGPSELLVICDDQSNPAYVASDLLSQAEHGPDSQVVLLAANCSSAHVDAIGKELDMQARALPRCDIVRKSIANSFCVVMKSVEEAIQYSNEYAPEHLILHVEDAESLVDFVENAGSIFVGKWSPESCGDYASGTNHVLPTYGYARMYSGVNTSSFVKHITSQRLTAAGLEAIGDAVMTLAEVEGLEGHRNAVAVRMKDIRKDKDLKFR